MLEQSSGVQEGSVPNRQVELTCLRSVENVIGKRMAEVVAFMGETMEIWKTRQMKE